MGGTRTARGVTDGEVGVAAGVASPVVHPLRERTADGPAYGAWLALPDPVAAEIVAAAGFDYVCIDLQHGLADHAAMVGMLQAVARTDAVPLVRVPWLDPGWIGRALDAGARGVIIPMVNTPGQAEAAVRACRYPPAGERSFGPIRAAAVHGADHADVWCIPMIETRAAVEALDEILDVDGIDAVYVGPADLSLSYGLPPANDQSEPTWNAALATIVRACQSRGIVPGIHGTARLAPDRVAAGFRFVTVFSDAGGLGAAAARDLAAARGSDGGGGGGGGGDDRSRLY